MNATQVAAAIDVAVSTVDAVATINSGGQDWVTVSYDNSSPPAMYRNRYMKISDGLNNADDLGTWQVDAPGEGLGR
jgi:hypothetical protein